MGSRNGRFLAYNADLHVLPSMNLELNKKPVLYLVHLYTNTT